MLLLNIFFRLVPSAMINSRSINNFFWKRPCYTTVVAIVLRLPCAPRIALHLWTSFKEVASRAVFIWY